MARIDYLTGAANQRLFFELAQKEIDRSQSYKYPFTIAYIDLDDFKTANDKFGHNIGDEIFSVRVVLAIRPKTICGKRISLRA